MGFFTTAHGWGGVKNDLFPKICHTYPYFTMMKLDTVIAYLGKTQKYT